MHIRPWMAGFLFVLAFSAQVRAADYCPQKISFYVDLKSITDANLILRNVYSALGCQTEFLFMSTPESLRAFNTGTVDGEAFRTDQIEPVYKAPFVRSRKPTFVTERAIWAHPDENIAKTRPIGLVNSAVWQQNYIYKTPVAAYQLRHFDSFSEMLAAFNRGEIGQFLCTEIILDSINEKTPLAIQPVKVRAIGTLRVHHYLHEDYRQFMNDFSDYIEQHNPFNTPQ